MLLFFVLSKSLSYCQQNDWKGSIYSKTVSSHFFGAMGWTTMRGWRGKGNGSDCKWWSLQFMSKFFSAFYLELRTAFSSDEQKQISDETISFWVKNKTCSTKILSGFILSCHSSVSIVSALFIYICEPRVWSKKKWWGHLRRQKSWILKLGKLKNQRKDWIRT